MKLSQTIQDRIQELSTQCGIEAELDEETQQYTICFGLSEGRTQEVYIDESVADPKARVLRLHSPCLVVEKGLFSGVSKAMAIELLRLNEQLNFARYGIQDTEESFIIVASCDLLLDTLQAEGFKAALECVALAADSYEAQFGQDIF